MFKPDVHITINSLSFSNFNTVNMVAIKKEKGTNFVRILDNVKKEYLKYVVNAWPSSVTRSRKFTACMVQTITDSANMVMEKYLINS